jgi:hypothetical protein
MDEVLRLVTGGDRDSGTSISHGDVRAVVSLRVHCKHARCDWRRE